MTRISRFDWTAVDMQMGGITVEDGVDLDDEAAGQARAPKGSPNGGQWVKGGGGVSGGGDGVAAALASVASPKYNAGAVLALTDKDPKTLSHYEKKVVAKYKKALAEEKAKAPAAPAKPAAKFNAENKPTVAGVDTQFESLSTSIGPHPSPSTPAMKAALNKVATQQYPAEKIKGLMDKDPTTLTHYEKKKLGLYKKALKEEQGSATATPAAPKKVDPKSAEAMAVFAEIGASKGMKADTVQKLATGEWAPAYGKNYQNDIQAQAQEYLKTGQKPVKPVIKSSSGAYGPSLAASLDNDPPPISNKNVSQQTLAGLHPLEYHEQSAATKYTGSTYHEINGALRKGSTHHLVPAIDSAIAKSYAKEQLVVVRGIRSSGMQAWLNKSGGQLKVGAVITDKGYASTTRQTQTASGFAGGNTGFGLKINVPKGAKILPLKSISNYAGEDEFLLPRGSSFKITSFDAKTKVITVDLVAA